jgi:hypothetical protein
MRADVVIFSRPEAETGWLRAPVVSVVSVVRVFSLPRYEEKVIQAR